MTTPDFHSGCTGKVPHVSYSEAKKRIARQSRRLKKRAGPRSKVNIYRCRVCRNWHIGGTAIVD